MHIVNRPKNRILTHQRFGTRLPMDEYGNCVTCFDPRARIEAHVRAKLHCRTLPQWQYKKTKNELRKRGVSNRSWCIAKDILFSLYVRWDQQRPISTALLSRAHSLAKTLSFGIELCTPYLWHTQTCLLRFASRWASDSTSHPQQCSTCR